MARNRVKLTIAGMEYTIVSDEPMMYVMQLGNDIDEAMRKLIEEGRMSPQKAAVLTAITEHDRAIKAEAAADNLRYQLQSYLDESTRLRAELERLRRRE